MNKNLLYLLLIFAIGEVWAQDNLDFLEKVNEKPKTLTSTKPTVDVKTSTKKANVVASKSRKKRSKKKNSNTTANNLPIAPVNPVTNQVPITNNPITQLPKPTVITPPVIVEQEEVASGLWIDSEIGVEPDGLPGFGGDLVIGKGNEGKNSNGVVSIIPSKPLFSFSEFFEKYKKAILIVGFIILFAFYRLRVAKPGSSNRPYRR